MIKLVLSLDEPLAALSRSRFCYSVWSTELSWIFAPSHGLSPGNSPRSKMPRISFVRTPAQELPALAGSSQTPFGDAFFAVWFWLLEVSRPLRHRLGLRQKGGTSG